MSLHVDVIDKGYFPLEIPPAFSTSSFAGATGYLPTDLNKFAQKASRCAYHSIPRLQHHRRLLGIPNPLHQARLSATVEAKWPVLHAHMNRSSLSLTKLDHVRGSTRGLERVKDFDALDKERLLRSSGSR